MFGQSPWFMRRPPLWARWVVSFAVAAALLVGLVAWVSHHNGNGLATVSPKAAARANREAEIVVSQDQAPQVVAVAAGASRAAVTHAIRRNITTRIATGQAGAPLQHVHCGRYRVRGAAEGFRCTATAAGVNYPYEAVLNSRAHTLTLCKHDAPPVPSQDIPVSRRCRL
ncbi:MAG: hypothetical protein ACR2NR_09800 [Solirubrobacteraceae bacterium]